MQIHAAQRNTELREEWMRKLASYTADQLVFVDELAANERTGHRKCGWSPVGITPQSPRMQRTLVNSSCIYYRWFCDMED